jgi:hypothetical protein
MAGEQKRIGLREVRALGPGEIVWDAAVAGFCARRQRGPAITYYVKYRTANGRQRWQVIGQHGVLTPDEARIKAKAILGTVVDGPIPQQKSGRPERQRRLPSCAISTSGTRKPGGC